MHRKKQVSRGSSPGVDFAAEPIDVPPNINWRRATGAREGERRCGS
jgi:hypothetical protein